MAASFRVWRIVGWTLLAFLVLLVPVYHYGGIGLTRSYALGYLVSLGNIIFSLISIRWAFHRKIRTFYAVILGGMALRFLLFAVVAGLVIAVLHWPLIGFLVSFVLFYLFLQYHEIRFINSELKNKHVDSHDRTDS
ncbi:MAG TPA: hypothetical protein PLG50_09985 [bacterium]|nr:hypothetical protein [bacterium]HQG45978.1 hypothetical protein [bacterium]HQI49250.1 hypothetical protein [bacterium]HQJ63574.1 hypothetical protein [bacterium]